MGSIQREDNYAGRWMGQIYAEAFRRLGLPMKVEVLPAQRLSMLLDQGGVDGDVARVFAYANAHPEAVRVEEPVFSVTFGLFTADPALTLARLEDLRGRGLRGIYVRGVAICKNTLEPLLGADRLTDITEERSGISMLLAARAEYYCTTDLALTNSMHALAPRDAARLRKLISIGDVLPLYPYLHRRNAALAPRLAEVLRQMKAEGLIARYQREAEREVGAK